ncbi:MAG: hypothetical protein QG614_505 [Patescibacteria group bacterium]|nr:hypothetical protein [Patescibacteria group bacterium]
MIYTVDALRQIQTEMLEICIDAQKNNVKVLEMASIMCRLHTCVLNLTLAQLKFLLKTLDSPEWSNLTKKWAAMAVHNRIMVLEMWPEFEAWLESDKRVVDFFIFGLEAWNNPRPTIH